MRFPRSCPKSRQAIAHLMPGADTLFQARMRLSGVLVGEPGTSLTYGNRVDLPRTCQTCQSYGQQLVPGPSHQGARAQTSSRELSQSPHLPSLVNPLPAPRRPPVNDFVATD